MRISNRRQLVKVHPRQAPGQRSTDRGRSALGAQRPTLCGTSTRCGASLPATVPQGQPRGPRDLEVHVVLDKVSSHKTPAVHVGCWATAGSTSTSPPPTGHGRTSSSGVRRAHHQEGPASAHRSVKELATDIKAWAAAWNENPNPFVWHKTADRSSSGSPPTVPPPTTMPPRSTTFGRLFRLQDTRRTKTHGIRICQAWRYSVPNRMTSVGSNGDMQVRTSFTHGAGCVAGRAQPRRTESHAHALDPVLRRRGGAHRDMGGDRASIVDRARVCSPHLVRPSARRRTAVPVHAKRRLRSSPVACAWGPRR